MSGSYIVIFKKGVSAPEMETVFSSVDGPIKHKYDMGDFKGFAADLSDQQLEKVLSFSQVDYFEADGQVSAFASSNPKKK